ncbi:hypothetical protein A5630_18645 [Mycolicibacterium mucogenicum]|uniref:Uncharacterized protein n=2 Tax=Mycolicibacterium mucogenicum TaxID=56689 RepID=A0A8H2PGM7_MYCMU|nr:MULTISPECIES: hypothetical protein [Mycobacteriaceae]KAB7753227.1 hypothetical protein MMUC44124_25320 [Mycolicibacterium mucogenicum DSM 44124]OBJ43666.1 hypothetical protein A5630_18645 [Mycolicibacterium mucogenicum]QPG67247.1 hypothetical protein C1S78_016895 [Mycolicibacterium mucogenicum DSM 44124]SEB15721.1 hypothetical protein SAMN04488580_108240 [Mycobacterium sp. 283mftsu]
MGALRVTADGLFAVAGQLEQHAQALSAHITSGAPLPEGQSTADVVAEIQSHIDAASAAHAERIWSVASSLTAAGRAYTDSDSSASAALAE